MKLKITYYLFIGCLVACVALSIASSGGRAAAQGWGNTGAPGDQVQTCITCHGNSTDIQVSIALEITDDASTVIDTEYTPGQTYSFKVNINDEVGTPDAYGFQLLALKAALNESGDETSEYSNLSANTQLSFASNTNRSYIEQTGPSATGEFTASWTAPEEGSGPVSIYFCGNGVNGNNMTSGDGAACGTIELAEGMASSTHSISVLGRIEVYPNPTSDFVNLTLNSSQSQDAQLSIVNIAGQVMESDAIRLNAGTNSFNRNMVDYPKGVYFLQLSTAEGNLSRKIVRQ